MGNPPIRGRSLAHRSRNCLLKERGKRIGLPGKHGESHQLVQDSRFPSPGKGWKTRIRGRVQIVVPQACGPQIPGLTLDAGVFPEIPRAFYGGFFFFFFKCFS